MADYAEGIGELFWFGYIVGWIGVAANVGGANLAAWAIIFAFGAVVCLLEIIKTYYEDYLVCTPSE